MPIPQSQPIAPYGLTLPARISFGRGTADSAGAEVAALGARVLVVRSASVAFADRLAADLTARGCAVTVEVARGEPTLPDLDARLSRLRPVPPDVVVAVGGGSALDLGKALAALLPGAGPATPHLEGVGTGRPLDAPPLPLVALPTTSGTGSEATRNAVVAVPGADGMGGRKVSLRDPRMVPRLAIVDPGLTDGCPRAVTLASGLDAITQLIEPYLSLRANPVTDALCADEIPVALAALVRLMQAEDPAARDAMAHASLCGGIALANAGLGAVHGLAGVLGGQTGAAHGALCGALLAPVLRANRAAMVASGLDTGRIDRVAGWIGAALSVPPDRATEGLQDWARGAGLPDLSDLARGADPQAVARDALQASSMRSNPVALPPATLAAILTGAV